MADRLAVVWTQVDGTPRRMGWLVATAAECRFSYDRDYLQSGLPGLALLAGPGTFGETPVVFRARPGVPLHPRLMKLIPADHPGNLQRRLQLRRLERGPNAPAPGFETEWALLMATGHGGIGHIDVFADDREAERWYQRSLDDPYGGTDPGALQNRLWQALRNEVRDVVQDPGESEELMEWLGPTPSVDGMMPKLLAAIPDSDGWQGRFARPDTPVVAGTTARQVVVKLEQPYYEGVTLLEAFALDYHRELGFEVPDYWLAEMEGMRVLAVERFDRRAGHPLPMESLLSVFTSGSHRVAGSTDLTLDEVGDFVGQLGRVVPIDTRQAQRELYRRLAVALMTGNGDLHLDNLSLLTRGGQVELAPVYDPAPMRAWSRHNLRMAIPMDFEPEAPVYTQIADVGRHFGLTRRQAEGILTETWRDTADYADHIEALEAVPAERRAFLAGVIRKERALLEAALSA